MDQPSFQAILANTPSWVYVVFIVLLVLGYQQSRNRTVGRRRLLILPAAMLCWSFYGVASSFGLGLLACLAWAVGVGAASTLFWQRLKSAVQPGPAGTFFVRGSWWPLALMMGIFTIKYVTGYALARNLAIALQPGFIGAVSLSLGILSGVFIARVGAALHVRPEVSTCQS